MESSGRNQQVLYSATTFRLLLDSLARPGKINALEYSRFPGAPPSFYSQARAANLPINFYALGALLTLLDGEVSFIVAANAQWQPANAPVVQWLALRSDANVAKPESAHFALFCDGRSDGLVRQLNAGTLLEPEESATAFYCVERLASDLDLDEDWLTLALSGPGILSKNIVHVAGLSVDEIEYIDATRRHYPLGIDVYLVDALGNCVGLPRTTRIHVAAPIRQARG
jgi:alpha-D-ribose 1-methylphosphonate 5-triphosphate synthase subunit PhnH